ncbi:Endoglucanase-4 [Arthrobotrys entomopaga]|nr:Endoglucanase-4 [Arthrobotrys entomopaga]
MKASLILFSAAASTVMGHGFVQEFDIGGQAYPGSNPLTEASTDPARITQPFFTNGESPIIYLDNNEVTCNRGAKAAKLVAKAPAGSKITFKWNKWFDDHKGPIITYLADCGGDCTKVNDGSSLSWFKIDEAGLINGVWATDILMKQNKQWTIQLPKRIKNGQYLMRHEMIALHLAFNRNGAQFYPSCSNIEITGGTGEASPPTVKFPQAYKPDDRSILLNIQGITSYKIPGPPVYTESDSVLSPKLNGGAGAGNNNNNNNNYYDNGNASPTQPTTTTTPSNNYQNPGNYYDTPATTTSRPAASPTPSTSTSSGNGNGNGNNGSQTSGGRKVCDDAYVTCANNSRGSKSSSAAPAATTTPASQNDYSKPQEYYGSGNGKYYRARRSHINARAQAYAEYSQEPCYQAWETCMNKLPVAQRYQY